MFHKQKESLGVVKSKAHLVSLYTVWAKAKCDLQEPGGDHVQKAWDIGMICASLKLSGERYRHESSRLSHAFELYAQHKLGEGESTKARGYLLTGLKMTAQDAHHFQRYFENATLSMEKASKQILMNQEKMQQRDYQRDSKDIPFKFQDVL